MNNILVKVFLSLGGLGAITHLVLTQGGNGLKAFLIWLMCRYPAARRFAAVHGPWIISAAQGLEKGLEGAVVDAEANEGVQPRPTDL